jgi:hypothetical protein
LLEGTLSTLQQPEWLCLSSVHCAALWPQLGWPSNTMRRSTEPLHRAALTQHVAILAMACDSQEMLTSDIIKE